MKKDEAPFRLSRVTLLLIFGPLVALAYFLGLNLPLLGPDEPRYAQVAREMWQRGDWITPTLGGHNWFEKPALVYWLQIAAYNVFGPTEFAARLGSFLFGLGTIASLWYLGRIVERQNDGKGFAVTFGLVAISTLGIIAFSHGASFDIAVTFPITAAIVSFYAFDAAERRGGRSILPLVLFYVFIGIALLAKGLIGIVFPFGIVGFYYLLSRRMPSMKLLASVFWGTLIATAITAIWYVPMYMRHGYAFIDEFIIQHHFQRFTSNKYLHPQPFYFFFWMLPLLAMPWCFFAVPTILKKVRVALNSGGGDLDDAGSLSTLAIAWLLVPLVFFTFSGSKLPGYIMPAVPPVCVLAAIWVRSWSAKSRSRGFATLGLAAGTLVLSIAVLVIYMPGFARGDSVKYLIAAADDAGFPGEQIACVQAIPYNAEFYAAGRLIRDADGNLRRFTWSGELADDMQQNHVEHILVLVSPQHIPQLLGNTRLSTQVIADNGEMVIAHVTLAGSSALQPVH